MDLPRPLTASAPPPHSPLQRPELVENTIHTGWLDLRIARKVLSGGPPWHLAVIAGAVVRAHEHISSQSAEYLAYLGKGQLPPAGVR